MASLFQVENLQKAHYDKKYIYSKCTFKQKKIKSKKFASEFKIQFKLFTKLFIQMWVRKYVMRSSYNFIP